MGNKRSLTRIENIRNNSNSNAFYLLKTLIHLPLKRGEERFREEGETAKKAWGGGRKEAKNRETGELEFKGRKENVL